MSDGGINSVPESPTADKNEIISGWQKCFLKTFRPFIRSAHTPPPDRTTFPGRLKDAFLCPPNEGFGNIVVIVLLLLAIWIILWSLTFDSALPGGHLFSLLLLEVLCFVGGHVASIAKLPPLLGMLLVGFLLRNVPYIDFAKDLRPDWSSAIRNIALAVIFLRAGLSLDPSALRRLSVVCVRLAFLPCLAETVAVACFSHLFLNFPWKWGFLLGFVLGAVSPAVIVPSILSLQERSLGTKKGIPTLVIAAASIDDVLAIAGFGVTLGITFATGHVAMTILHGPLEVLMGLTYGVVLGIMLWFVPNKQSDKIVPMRFVLLLGCGLMALLGSQAIGFAGSGALACLCLAFVAAFRWRKEAPNVELDLVSTYFGYLWIFLQPFLFGLIGAEISVDVLEPTIIGYGIATIACSLVIRSIVSLLAVLGAGFNWKEKIFISLAWLPKATVQAAIGPVALDYARAKDAGEAQDLAIKVLTIAVLSIIITAPLGAAAIAVSAPRLLSSDQPEEPKHEKEGSSFVA